MNPNRFERFKCIKFLKWIITTVEFDINFKTFYCEILKNLRDYYNFKIKCKLSIKKKFF